MWHVYIAPDRANNVVRFDPHKDVDKWNMPGFHVLTADDAHIEPTFIINRTGTVPQGYCLLSAFRYADAVMTHPYRQLSQLVKPDHGPGRAMIVWHAPRALGPTDPVDRLNTYGRKAYGRDIVTERTDASVAESLSNVVIYQEIDGNPLNAANRAYMWYYVPIGPLPGDMLHIYYNDAFRLKANNVRAAQKDGRVDINLHHHMSSHFCFLYNIHTLSPRGDQDLIKLRNRHPPSPHNSCFMLKKCSGLYVGTPQSQNPDAHYAHPDGAISIDGMSYADVVKTLKSRNFFYCYDQFSFWPPVAALYGCVAIVVPLPGFEDLKDIYRTKAPWMYYGVAWGVEPSELLRAEQTRPTLANLFRDICDGTGPDGFFTYKSPSANSCLVTFLRELETAFGVRF
jgi:hypothetical protein